MYMLFVTYDANTWELLGTFTYVIDAEKRAEQYRRSQKKACYFCVTRMEYRPIL